MTFVLRSVVIIAFAELPHPVDDSLRTILGSAFIIFSFGKGTPIIPVEAIKTSFELIESSCESSDAKDSQSLIPLGPVQALAFPLLTKIARNVFEFFRIFRHHITVGETTLFEVNTPAAIEGF